ncbi:chemotaxis protein CheB [soil metagenome]
MTFELRPPSLRVAVIGAHAEAAVGELVAALTDRCGLAVVIAGPAQSGLIDVLRKRSRMPVTEVRTSVPLEVDRVFVVAPDHDATVAGRQLVLSPDRIKLGQLDRLFRSASDDLGRDLTAVLLGGTGVDGTLGIKRAKEAGSLTIAERGDGGELVEMPGAAIATGLIDQVLPLAEIGPQLRAFALEAPPDATVSPPAGASDEVADTLRDILTFVRVRTGHDFSAYKRATLYRRVARRMQVRSCETIAEYHQLLRERPEEMGHLLRDFLISVTNFFRDPAAFATLESQVIPKLFAGRGTGDQVRVWVAGCATGEEVYSLAMLLLEHAGRMQAPPILQIFATDIDEDSLMEARAGRYLDTIAVDVSPERLERYFTHEPPYYQVTKQLREIVLFSPHNVLRDPPFSRLDLVSCRNLMIYLNRDAQNRVLSMFHFGLRPDGYLMLGSSESAENTALFSALDPQQRIFTRRLTAGTIQADGALGAGRWPIPHASPVAQARPTEKRSTLGEIHHRLVERYAPPSILVNGELDVVHLSESAGKFLEPAGGEPTHQILRMIHPALRLDLRAAIYAARQPPLRADVRRVVFDDNGQRREIEIHARAIEMPELGANAALIYLDENLQTTGEVPPPRESATIEPVLQEVEEELHRTREQLRATIEQYETSLEELKASNEELQAINEELRSASEEIETSKEELQSVNEELTTLNHELKEKIFELSHTNSDLQNLMTSTDLGVVFLDRQLHIKRFTPRALDLFNLIPSDIGRPLAHVTHRLAITEMTELARDVLQTLRTIERDVTSETGRRYLLRLLPYRSVEDRIDGVVLTFIEVSDLRNAVEARDVSQAALELSEVRLRASLRDAPLMVLSVDPEAHVTWGYLLGKEIAPSAAEDLELFTTGEDADRFVAEVRAAIATRSPRRVELALRIDGDLLTYDVRIDPTGIGATVVGFDISPSKQAQASLLDADRRKDDFLATLSHELRNPLTPLKIALDVARLAKNDPVQIARSHAIMERQVSVLSRLVDDLLDISRITQGKIELARIRVDPAVVIEGALEATRPLIHELGHSLEVKLPASPRRVLGDVLRLTQVMTNLLTNAAKYTPAGGHIVVAVEHDLQRNVVVIKVIDDGIGIDPELLPRVFDIFFQCRDDHGRSRGGLGIGLNLVRKLTELHGGRVSVTSPGIGRGSQFAMELPLLHGSGGGDS